jgi:membrane protease YdiL (CAAX protease family)
VAAAAAGAAAAGIAIAGLGGFGEPDATQKLLLSVLGLQAFLALVALAGARVSSAPLEERLGLVPGRLGAPLLGLLVAGALALSFALDGVLSLSELRGESALGVLDEELRGLRGSTLALALVCVGLAPGIAEELLCRGLVQRGLAPRLGAPAAIGLGAALFGALHVEWIHGVLAAVLGLYFGCATHIAGSVRAAMLCHGVNNLLAVAVAAWAPEAAPSPAVAVVTGLPVAGGCLWVVWRRAGAPPRKSGLQPAAGSDDP